MTVAYAPSPIVEWARASMPPPRLTIAEWADQYRMLPEASAAQGGRWRTATAPYLAGIMQCAARARRQEDCAHEMSSERRF